MYDLSEAEAQRSGEYKGGIGRLLEMPEAVLSPEVAAYVRLVRECAGPGKSAITAYPGSPLILSRCAGPTDRLVLAETHAKEAQSLRGLLRPAPPGFDRRERRLRGTQGAVAAARKPRAGADRPALRVGPGVRSHPCCARTRLTSAGRPACIASGTRSPSVRRRCGSGAISNASGIRECSNATLSVLPDDAAVGMRGAGVIDHQSAVDARRTTHANCCPTCIACSCRKARAVRPSSGGRRMRTASLHLAADPHRSIPCSESS